MIIISDDYKLINDSVSFDDLLEQTRTAISESRQMLEDIRHNKSSVLISRQNGPEQKRLQPFESERPEINVQ